MKQAKVIHKFEVVVNGVVFEFEDLKTAERKMRSLNKDEFDKSLLRKELKGDKLLQTYLLE